VRADAHTVVCGMVTCMREIYVWYQELLSCGQKEGIGCNDQCWLNTMMIPAGSPLHEAI